MMFNGYPTRVALTSLALLTLLGASPGPPSKGGCAQIPRLYSRRALQELRGELRVAYAIAHERRAERVLAVLRHERPVDELIRTDHTPLVPQDTGDPKRNRLLDYVVAHCMPR